MLIACIIINILAIALPSLRISPLLLILIATIALLYAAALSFNVVYIQSIGSGIGFLSELLSSYGLALLALVSLFYVLEIENLLYFINPFSLDIETPIYLAAALICKKNQ